MTDQTTTERPRLAPAAAQAAAEPTLITEQQVLFNTAAAGARPPAKARRRPGRRDFPKRHAYLEDALMAREMDRL